MRIGAEVTDGQKVGVIAAFNARAGQVLVITPKARRIAGSVCRRWWIDPRGLVLIGTERMRVWRRMARNEYSKNVVELLENYCRQTGLEATEVLRRIFWVDRQVF